LSQIRRHSVQRIGFVFTGALTGPGPDSGDISTSQ